MVPTYTDYLHLLFTRYSGRLNIASRRTVKIDHVNKAWDTVDVELNYKSWDDWPLTEIICSGYIDDQTFWNLTYQELVNIIAIGRWDKP